MHHPTRLLLAAAALIGGLTACNPVEALDHIEHTLNGDASRTPAAGTVPEPGALEPAASFATADGWTVSPQCGAIVVDNGTGLTQWPQIVNGNGRPLGVPAFPTVEPGASFAFDVHAQPVTAVYWLYSTAIDGGWGRTLVTKIGYVDC